MYRKYVDQIEPQSASDQQQASTMSQQQQEISQEDKWRSQWVPKKEDELYKSLTNNLNNKSLLKQFLTEERYQVLKDKKTDLGGTLAQCISSGKHFYRLSREMFLHLFSHVSALFFSTRERFRDVKIESISFGA